MLRKLSLHGFKSFCDRTEITLGSGITAIVGPNGCGKSNLADALRWVLGEQNPRVLRSAKSQDVIFAGTQTKKAMGMAEVRLLFDSIGGDSEVEIARRIARDGSGEYRLNGKVCRWKDIIETLAGTGLSHTGYVVIGQGTIHELASGKPEDRRAWMEEASGVAKVRLDKRDMESKLEAAKADIARLDDLTYELSARLERLTGDRETARTYQELVKKRRDLDLSMWLYQFDEEMKRVATLTRRLEKYRAEQRDAEISIPKLLSLEESLREKRAPLNEKVSTLVARREEAASELLALEKRRDAVRGRIAVLSHEVQARTARRSAIVRDIERLNQEAGDLEARLMEAESAFKQAASTVTEIEEKRLSREAARKELSDKVIGVRTEAVALTAELGATQRSKEDVRRRLEGARRERIALGEYLSTSYRERDRLEKELAISSSQLEESILREDAAKKLQEDLERKVSEARAGIDREISTEKNLGARLAAVKARRKMLEDMERTFEGYGRGPRSILEARQKGVLKGIEGAVGEVFSCDAKYIPALSAAVGGAAENIIVSDEAAAKAGIALLKEQRSGRVTFLPLSIIRPRNLNPGTEAVMRRSTGVRPLISVVSYPSDMEPAAKYLIGRIVLADTLDLGLRFMRESGWSTRVVTLTGDSIEPGGAISGGEAPRSEALFRRKQELSGVRESDRTLGAELESVLSRRKGLENELRSLAQQTADARANAARASSDVVKARESRTRLESSAKVVRGQIEEKETQVPALAGREEQLESELSDLSSRERDISAGLSDRQENLGRFEDEMQRFLALDKDIETEVRDLIAEREELERDLSAIQRRLLSLGGEKTSHQRSLEEEEKEIARQESLLDDASNEERSLSGQITALDKNVSALQGEVTTAEAERESVSERLDAVSSELERLGRDKVTLAARVDEIASEVQTSSAAAQEVKDLILQEFGISDIGSVEHPRIPRSTGLSAAEELDGQIKSLGGVNLKAEEEFDDVVSRIDLIATEKEDVLSAIDEVNRARETVEKEIEARFLQTFGCVRNSFREIFEELFGGGKGDLALIEGSLGVEVIAEPPGRRQKHLNLLSGGERSLCGIALIFAILSYKASPFIVLDEADTALDESNIVRYSRFLKRYAEDTQFLVVTHQKATMEAADLLYGVTMEEPGVSKVFGMRLENQ